MTSRRVAILAMALSLGATQARAQCTNWATGPLVDTAPSGAAGASGAGLVVLAFTSWDPDGTGAQQPMLVGGFHGVPLRDR